MATSGKPAELPPEIDGVRLLSLERHEDGRGTFIELYQRRRYQELGIEAEFVQDNLSWSKRGALRGLHYQVGEPQGKLVQVLTGEVFDVVIDLRRGSNTFGRWAGFNLHADIPQQLWIPPGLAHGFYVRSASALVYYKVTARYAPERERTLRWDDPQLAIDWPLPPDVPLLMSEKDSQGASFDQAETYP